MGICEGWGFNMNLNTRRSGCPHPDNNHHKTKIEYHQNDWHKKYLMNDEILLCVDLCRDEGNPTYGGFYD